MSLMGVLLSMRVWARSGPLWGGRLLPYWRGLVGGVAVRLGAFLEVF